MGVIMNLVRLAPSLVPARLGPDFEGPPSVPESQRLDLDKDWTNVHYALVGGENPTDDTASEAIYGTTGASENEMFVLVPASSVGGIAAALQAVKRKRARKRLSKIIDEEEEVDFVMEYYDELVAFYAAAAKDGHAVVIEVG